MDGSDGDAKYEHESYSEEEAPSEEELDEEPNEEQQRDKEVSEEEGSYEEIEELVVLDEEEEVEEDLEEEFNDEAELCKKQITEGISWKEPSDREQIGREEDPAEGFEIQSSSDCNVLKCELDSEPSSSEKKRRLADELLGYMPKRQKQNEDSELGLCSYSISTGFEDKAKSLTCDANLAEKESDGSSGKKKRSRWDRVEIENDPAKKKRKTRWVDDDAQSKLLGPLKLPDFVNTAVGDTSTDPVIKNLNSQLRAINKKLNAPVLVDGQPSASSDIGMSKRQQVLRGKLIKCRQRIISELIKRNPAFAPPSDNRLPKLYKKLYIPVKEYPGYNFIGLILGPRGNTQKRMEMETGAKIFLRGKGSTKQGYDSKWKNAKHESSADEDLHVCIYADTQKSLDAAVQLVEKLLVPVEEEMNDHKQAQLRELAALNGTHRKASSNLQKTTSTASYPRDICGNALHPTPACPLTASDPETNKSESFFPNVGNTRGSSFMGPPIPSSRSTLTVNQQSHVPALPNSMPLKEIDEAKLFVSYLPQSVNDNNLKELFSPFGCISQAAVIKDKTTGLSKGYGFVKYNDSASATAAATCMNGYRIDGKMLSVEISSQSSSASQTFNVPEAAAKFNNLPTYPSRAAVSEGQLGVMTWPRPPGSMLSETHATFPEQSSFVSHSDFITGPSPLLFHAPHQNLAIASSEEHEQFLGYQESVDFEDQSCRLPYFNVPLPQYVLPTQAGGIYRVSFPRPAPPSYMGPHCFRNQGNTSL